VHNSVYYAHTHTHTHTHAHTHTHTYIYIYIYYYEEISVALLHAENIKQLVCTIVCSLMTGQ